MADPVRSLLTSGTSATASTTVSFTAPASGVLITLSIISDDYVNATPSGWTLVSNQNTGFHGSSMFFKFSDGSQTSVAYTTAGAFQSVYVCEAHTNIDNAAALVVGNGAHVDGGGGLVASTPSVTPGSAIRAYSVAHVGFSSTTSAFTSIGSWTSSYSAGTNSFNASTTFLGVGTANLAWDATGSNSTSTSGTCNSNSPLSFSGVIAVFKVASGTVPPPPQKARRSLRYIVPRRGRVVRTPQPGPPPPPTFRSPNASRRPWRGLRVARARTTVTPQPGLPPPPVYRPPVASRRLRFLPWIADRARSSGTPPPPPVVVVVRVPPIASRRLRFLPWIADRARSSGTPPAPPPVVVVPVPPIPQRRSRVLPWIADRARTSGTPPAVPVPMPLRHRAVRPRFAFVRRGRQTVTPPIIVVVPPPVSPPRRRRAWLGLRWTRGHSAAVTPISPTLAGPFYFTPPTVGGGRKLGYDPDGPGHVFRHFASPPRGRNVWKLLDGTYTFDQPYDMSTVAIEYLGGHIYSVTLAERNALIAAGFVVTP